MNRLLCAAALLLLPSISGCVFYTDGDDEPCVDYGAPEYWSGYRDPATGVCQDFGGGGGGCYGPVEPQALPDWASCPGACEGLDETSCMATAGCRASYWQETCPPWADCDVLSSPVFQECWGTAQSGPVQGACEGLDAYECSRHDDCLAVYERNWEAGDEEISTMFSYCAPEPWSEGCYSDMDCPTGYECTSDTECLPPPECQDGADCPAVCYGRCVPQQWGCEAVDCAPGYHCEMQCYPCDSTDPDVPCDSYCETICVPDVPWTCDDGTVCPEGTHCETRCDGMDCPPGETCPEVCWTECVPDAPGTCDGEVLCDSLPPACPDGTVPGIANGCWTGYCIPVEDCGTAVACETLATEAECASRADCVPVYQGYGCTCYPDSSCTCEIWEYQRCETGGGVVEPMPPPQP